MAAQTNSDFAAEMVSNVVKGVTKSKYKDKLVHVMEFFKKVHPHLIDTDEESELKWHEITNTEEGKNAIMEFYRHISKKRTDTRL